MLRTLYCLLLVQLISCSPRVLEVKQTHYFHDNYLLFRKNGYYSNKALALGVFRLPDFQRGRYAMQHDSVYFIKRSSRTDFIVYAYGFIDTVNKQFRYRHIDSTMEEIYYITEMPTRRRDREQGYK